MENHKPPKGSPKGVLVLTKSVAAPFLKGRFHNPLFFEKLCLVCLVRVCVREYLYCIGDSISWIVFLGCINLGYTSEGCYLDSVNLGYTSEGLSTTAQPPHRPPL